MKTKPCSLPDLRRLIFSGFAVALCLSATAQGVIGDSGKSKRVDAFLRESMAKYHIPGASIAVLQRGKLVFQKGFGIANLEHQAPSRPDTSYYIASLTKMFTATAVMMLVHEGLVSLDDRIDKHVKGLPAAWQPVTVLQLMNHTSGIVYPMSQPFPCKVEGDSLRYTREMVIAETGCLPLEFPSGTKYAYSGRGYYVLGLLVEQVSGKSFGDFLNERIFKPLGMNDTRMIDHTSVIPHRSSGYIWKDGVYQHDPYRVEAVIELSDGGLMSTVLDLAKWDASLYTEQIIKRATFDQMLTNGRLNDGSVIEQYGMGFELKPYKGRERFGHAGLIPGFSSAFERFTKGDLTVILLTNAEQENYTTVPNLAREIALMYLSK